jgi:hypothetical protein
MRAGIKHNFHLVNNSSTSNSHLNRDSSKNSYHLDLLIGSLEITIELQK